MFQLNAKHCWLSLLLFFSAFTLLAMERQDKVKCQLCAKPVSKSNFRAHEKRCRGVDQTISCEQVNCTFSTTKRKDFKAHCKEDHNLRFICYNIKCEVCDCFVLRKKKHLQQKRHIALARGNGSDPFTKVFSWKTEPNLKNQKSDNGLNQDDQNYSEEDLSCQQPNKKRKLENSNNSTDLTWLLATDSIEEEELREIINDCAGYCNNFTETK